MRNRLKSSTEVLRRRAWSFSPSGYRRGQGDRSLSGLSGQADSPTGTRFVSPDPCAVFCAPLASTAFPAPRSGRPMPTPPLGIDHHLRTDGRAGDRQPRRQFGPFQSDLPDSRHRAGACRGRCPPGRFGRDSSRPPPAVPQFGGTLGDKGAPGDATDGTAPAADRPLVLEISEAMVGKPFGIQSDRRRQRRGHRQYQHSPGQQPVGALEHQIPVVHPRSRIGECVVEQHKPAAIRVFATVKHGAMG